MAESEVDKAAAEAYPDTNWGLAGVVRERVAYARGWNDHASRLSPPTREELIEVLHRFERNNSSMPRKIGWSADLADAILARFSLSAPEEEWEYGVHHVESGGDASMLVHESREAAESDLATCGMFCDLARRTKAIPAGPWLPVPAPETGENRG